ncbi:hypothetical protein [Actinoplanes sp. NBRC 103695]|uniref:hypothetical protein n=1 Tax=Actinoplanes sp. NBRC 103695 TaxID=3032202 RepID=UPI0024A3746E|nr:hypothetical protein [Actinoplanes sp. NBRC 103695]GLZ01811.1 hypothetical protein Acsp02_90620 [Actinoplanes sp. NBRC 103695]
MTERDLFGVDLVEIGREPQEDLPWVLDVAARNALFLTAVGASDDHDGGDRLAAWAPTRLRSDVVPALRRGAAGFVDPVHYRGTMDLRVAGDSATGAVSLTKATSGQVDAVATALPAGSFLGSSPG